GAHITGLHEVNVAADATAGNGGDATGAGAQAANGTGIFVNNPATSATGLISGTSTNGPGAGGDAVSAETTQTAGNGGNAINGAFAGNGGNAIVNNAITGATPGLLQLRQTAIAGDGGNSDMTAGVGGNAISNLVLNQTGLPVAQQSSTMMGTSTA